MHGRQHRQPACPSSPLLCLLQLIGAALPRNHPCPCPCTAPKPQVVTDTINEGRPYKLRVAKTKAAWEAWGQEGRRLLGLAVRLEESLMSS